MFKTTYFSCQFSKHASKLLQSNSGDHQVSALHTQFCTSKLLKYISIRSTAFLHQVLQDYHLSLLKVKGRVIFCGGMRATTRFIIWQTSVLMPRGFQNLLLISAQSLRVERWNITVQSRKGIVDHWTGMNPTTMNNNKKLTTWKHKGSILNNILTFWNAFVCYYNVETFLSEILIYENIMIN